MYIPLVSMESWNPDILSLEQKKPILWSESELKQHPPTNTDKTLNNK